MVSDFFKYEVYFFFFRNCLYTVYLYYDFRIKWYNIEDEQHHPEQKLYTRGNDATKPLHLTQNSG